MGRDYCARCHYPRVTCICKAISPVDSPIRIILMQHPKEVHHAKNSGRLIQLCIANSQRWVGENNVDFAALQKQVETDRQNYTLIYPSEQSHPIEDLPQPTATIKNLILIDSTWRKAFKIYKLNPWLQTIRHLHFEAPPDSQYHIRKTHISKGRSTIESVYYSLNQLTNTNTQPLMALFTAMQNQHYRPK